MHTAHSDITLTTPLSINLHLFTLHKFLTTISGDVGRIGTSADAVPTLDAVGRIVARVYA